jgi:hypothetical protein
MNKKRSLFDGFQVFATKASVWLGTKWAFAAALMLIVGWAAVGPHFQYSDTWQFVVNTTTTIVTLLMVFLIQNSQNRDAKAIHLKLDEISLNKSAPHVLLERSCGKRPNEICRGHSAPQWTYVPHARRHRHQLRLDSYRAHQPKSITLSNRTRWTVWTLVRKLLG